MKADEHRHLSDDQMIAVYSGADTKLRNVDRTLEHLSRCPRCAERYQLLADRIAELQGDAVAEADAVFGPAQLEKQHAQIMARLEHLGHPARVIPFPAHSRAGMSIITGRQFHRWIAGAAAACLLIGFGLGRLADFSGVSTQQTQAPATVTQPARTSTPMNQAAPPPALSDDEVLSKLDRSFYLEPVQALEALDAMTPQPQQVALRVRR